MFGVSTSLSTYLGVLSTTLHYHTPLLSEQLRYGIYPKVSFRILSSTGTAISKTLPPSREVKQVQHMGQEARETLYLLLRSLCLEILTDSRQDEPWKWANEVCSTSDGHLIYQRADPLEEDLTHYIEGLPPFLTIEKEQSDTPNTLLWSITGPVKSASGKTPGYSTEKLGKPTNLSRWFAVVRLWSPWIAPRQGKDRLQPDKEAVLAAFERHDGSHLVVLAVSGIEDVLTTLNHDGEGRVVVNSQNDTEKEGIVRLIAAAGKSLENAVAAAMYHARKIVMKYEVVSGEMDAELKALTDGFKPEWLENWCKLFFQCF